MSYASLMVHIDNDEESQGRVRLAAGLADRFGAKLAGVAAAAPRLPVGNDGVIDMALLEAARIEIREMLNRLEADFRNSAALDAHRLAWRDAVSPPTDFLIEVARAADLLIVGRKSERKGNAHYALDEGDVLLRAGRPVLLVPPAVQALRGERVIVAWKNTREARRATLDALPLLVRAESVTVLSVKDDGGDAGCAGLEDVGAWFRDHGIKARTELRPNPAGSVAGELVDAANRDGAGLIVAGAYGHSRLREWIFGGVTRDLLAGSPVCCLMAS